MNAYIVEPSHLKGTLKASPSKSHTIRAIAFGMMGKGKTEIYNYLDSPDISTMIDAARQFGINIHISKEKLEIFGAPLQAAQDVIKVNNSGLTLRLIAALAGRLPSYTILTGDDSIRNRRPMQPLLDGLKQLGGFAESSRCNGHAPVMIKGPLRPGRALIDGADSQPVSALLIAASFLEGRTTLCVENPGELPWINLTLDWLKFLGIEVSHQNYTNYEISGHAQYSGFQKTIPGDWSSAAYPIAAALITKSEIELIGVDINDAQGDKKLIETLIAAGAHIEIGSNRLHVHGGFPLQGMEIDINEMIDMMTIIPVIASFAEGPTRIYNGQIARCKESDRIASISKELKKMGAHIEEQKDGMVIYPSILTGAQLESHADHRIAMALTVASLAAKGPSIIKGVSCIAKTYPTFQKAFHQLGAHIG